MPISPIPNNNTIPKKHLPDHHLLSPHILLPQGCKVPLYVLHAAMPKHEVSVGAWESGYAGRTTRPILFPLD